MSLSSKNLKILEDAGKEIGCLIYSRGGTVPYLTQDNLDKIVKDKHTVWHIPMSTIYEQPGSDVIKAFGKSFKEFCNLENCTLLLNVVDSLNPKQDLYKFNKEKSTSIWAPSGSRSITPDEYIDVLETFGINICIPPSDMIPGSMANKRCQKSCDRSVRFLDRCLLIRKEKNLDMPVFGVLEGGNNIPYRQKCAKEVIKREIDGYVFSGFNVIGKDWKEVLISTLEFIKDDKLKIMFGTFTPIEIIEAVQLGIHLFDSVICNDAAEQGLALNFNYTAQDENMTPEITQIPVKSSPTSIPHKKQKQECDSSINGKKDLSSFSIDLHDKIYFEDMRPLVLGCSCYCCSHYTRAYLHHLIVTKEMLVEVLLMMHNLHHWLSFFTAVKVHEKDDSLEELLKLVSR